MTPHWSHAHEPFGLSDSASRLLWTGRLIARCEERWGQDDRLLGAAIKALDEHLRLYPRSYLLLSPDGRLKLEEGLAAAVDDTIPMALDT